MSNERFTRAWTLVLTSVAFFMVALDTLVVMTALPAIRRDLGASLATLEWTVNAFTLAFAAGITTAAALGDRSGRRRVFAIGLTLFSASSAACALAPTASILIAARALQGAAAAMVMPLSLTILVAAFPPERRGAIVGIWGGIGGLAVASGPLVGGAITQGLDWHWIFWVNVPIGLLATALALTRLVESRGPRTRLDVPAVALVSAGAVCVVWGLVRAGEVGWLDSKTIATQGIGLAALGGFLAWERRAADPMLPLRLFSSRPFTAAIGTSFLMAGALTSAAFLISQYLQLALGYSPLSTGLRLLPWTATPLLVAPLAGQLSDRIGRRPILVVGMLLQGIGLGWFASLASAEVDYRRLVLPLIIAGVGVSMAMPVAPAAALSAVSRQDMGKASGVSSTLQRFGSAFGIAVAAAVFAAYGHLGSAAGFVAGFPPALAVAAALSLLGATLALAIGPTKLAAVAAKPEAPAA
ncbi:MAG TPA: DHA2 family efflux MFS transporter permease subunit [Myxococcaceae bacterium]|nr:DHA2 family efflux MFS transporter permease subunit [Myxococcaceae bacterium]